MSEQFQNTTVETGKIETPKKSLKMPKGGNHNLYIEEEQTIQWPKEKVQTTIYKTYNQTKDRVTQTSLNSWGEPR
jgi:hypothetical protein